MNKPSSIEVWGGEAVGDKAGMLIEHESLITEHGMQIPPTVVLASEAAVAFAKRKPPTEEDFARIGPTPLAQKILSIVQRFNGEAGLAVRSSAAGDARGSGIYESRVVVPERAAVYEALRDVGDSFRSEVARDFRKQLGLSDEFAIIFQPLIGQLLDRDDNPAFGPPLSGTAYSSTPAHSAGLVKVVAGFGGGVDRQGAERITAEELEELSGPHFERYVDMGLFDASFRHGVLPVGELPGKDTPVSLDVLVHARAQAQLEGALNGISDFRDTKQMFLSYQPDQGVPGLALWKGHIHDLSIQKYDYGFDEVKLQETKAAAPLLSAMERFEPASFLEILQQMEQRAGYPLYIEWATTVVGGTIIPWVVQIAPAEHKTSEETEIPDFEEFYYRANTVTGSGKKTASKIVSCTNPRDVEHLRAYNSDPRNEGYILVYSAHLTTSLATHGEHIYFRDCHRASVILEIQNAKHGSASPAEHMLGGVDLTDKFFGVVDSVRMTEDMYEALDALPTQKWRDPSIGGDLGAITLREGNFTVVADKLNDRLLVGRVDT